MFFKKVSKDVSLSELIETYAPEYFLNVDYRNDGSVTLWFGSKRDVFKPLYKEEENGNSEEM